MTAVHDTQPDHLDAQPAQAGPDRPDVVLDVPKLEVADIVLEVEQLKARVALDANVLELLRLHVGADVELGRVSLDIRGVEAQAHLKVRLQTLAVILDRVFASVDHNPRLLERLVEQLAAGVSEAGGAVGSAVGEAGGAVASGVGEVANSVAHGT